MASAKASTEKLELLRKRQAELVARIAQVEAAENAKRRREDTRLKVLIGAAFIADTDVHPETRASIVSVLRRAIKAPRDIEFLKEKSWL